MKALISRVALAICAAYAFEAFLLGILWLNLPGLAPLAGLLQIPTAYLSLGIPPPAIAPNGERDFMVLMFLVQGFVFSLVVLGVQFLARCVRLMKANWPTTRPPIIG